jgi:hypothetical protein
MGTKYQGVLGIWRHTACIEKMRNFRRRVLEHQIKDAIIILKWLLKIHLIQE